MTVHFLHTSDWHLGQFFYNHSRHYEHEQFLAWLIHQIQNKQPDALLISGDIFDVINPSASAQKQLYQFLADAHAVAPHMQTLMIAGNHDSGYRIEQVEPLLQKYNAQTVGTIRWNTDKTLNSKHLIIPITNKQKETIAWCVALPFLRNAEITGFNDETTDSQSAIDYLHKKILAEVHAIKTPDQPVILMSHAHMQGAQESDSERPIIIGHQEALSTALFGDHVDYVALGHLHKPQKVQHDYIRYSGSPIPLSFSEANYKHQVVEVWLDSTFKFEPLYVPRCVALHPIKGTLSEVMQKINQLPKGEIPNIDQREYVDIEYQTNAPPPLNLRQQIEDALPKNRYRLVRICRKYIAYSEQDVTPSKIDLAPPTPEALFKQVLEKNGFEADENLLHDFSTLIQDTQP